MYTRLGEFRQAPTHVRYLFIFAWGRLEQQRAVFKTGEITVPEAYMQERNVYYVVATRVAMLLPAAINQRSGCSFVALFNNKDRSYKSTKFTLSLLFMTTLCFSRYQLVESLTMTKKVTTFNQDFPQKRFRTVELTEDSTTNPQLLTLRDASIARIFGAIAEDRVLIDISQGKCCFSGCPGCDFYNDDGTYQYEEFRAYIGDSLTYIRNASHTDAQVDPKATLAAWIPVYSYRSVGGTEKHVARWTRILFPTGTDKFLSKDMFCQRLLDAIEFLSSRSHPVIECEDAMLHPAKSFSVHISDAGLLKDPSLFFQNTAIQNSTKMAKKFENSKYDKEAVETFWMLLAVHGSSLTKRQIQDRLKKWNDVSNNSLEGIGFSSYSKKMLEAISVRYGDV